MHANTKFDERLKTKEFDRKIADVVKEKILLTNISYFFKAGVTRKLRILLFRKNLKKKTCTDLEDTLPRPEKIILIKFTL